MRLRTSLLSAVLCLGLLTGACSQSKPDAADLRKDLSSELQKGRQRLTKRQADCYAKLIIEKVGADAVNDVGFNAKEPSKDMAADLAAVAATAGDTCDIPAP
jgi:hypothetical protein